MILHHREKSSEKMAASNETCLRLSVKLAEILDVPQSSDILEQIRNGKVINYRRYVFGIKEENDLSDYLCGLLDASNPTHRTLIDQFVATWRRAAQNVMLVTDIPNGNDNNSMVTNESPPASKGKSIKTKYWDASTAKQSSPAGSAASHSASDTSVDYYQSNDRSPEVSSHQAQSSSKFARKVHYSPLFSEEGQDNLVIKLPGRHKCECQATKHRLINNCLACGRIVCSQEGSGPCHSCGNLVCTNEEQETIDRDSKQSRLLLKKLSTQMPKKADGHVSDEAPRNLKKAVEHKDRLLEFDRTVKRRTKVIDDQSDFFGVDNRWLSPEERQALVKRERELNEKRENARQATKLTFDFAGRKVVEEKDYDDDTLDEEEFLRLTAKKGFAHSDVLSLDFGRVLERPVYNPNCVQRSRTADVQKATADFQKATAMRLQGSELQQMSDEGRCLSVHQPNASLLVTGLKKHEGRSWYSPLRGRLWIASTVKKPNQNNIREEEHTIRALNNGKTLEFPASYPVGALLGCVNVVDCLPQEDYRDQYPDGESSSPYVLICDNPQTLILKLPIKGERNIYKLEPAVHRAAKMSLRAQQ